MVCDGVITCPIVLSYIPVILSCSSVLQASLFDTAGGERYRTLTSNYYMNSDAAILVYSVDSNYSFARLRDEVENAARFIHSENFVWVLLGHKSDLSREVPVESVLALAKEINTRLCFYASSKTGENVVEVLETVMVYVHKTLRGRYRPSNTGTHKLTTANDKTKVTKSQSTSAECAC